ncbi:MFS transporter [Paenibacillus sp. P26]|nr:MFS transporter [Paenibacillus sp. P26]
MYFLYYAATGVYQPYVSVYLQSGGLSGVEIGSVLGIVPVIGFLAPLLWGWTADRYNRNAAIMTILLCGAPPP